ncbi:hypothetical protein J5N97_020497 [Dioscorea zingiberensis]|uniref:Uncharacterized protein n=1 Tax=Dioscorea zingiberensis TaxID=325984 RepID=A0A9D5CG02_9LILI|nr:hypothetical protein J5N97_020497 [Dioscorea zingiberensis]
MHTPAKHPTINFIKALCRSTTYGSSASSAFFSTPRAIPIASKFSISHAFFSVFTASLLTFIRTPHSSLLEKAPKARRSTSPSRRRGSLSLKLWLRMEVERDLVELLEDLHEKPVLPLGLLAPAPPTKDQVKVDMEKHKEIFASLDGQRERSIVYVAFGSEATLSVELRHQLCVKAGVANLPFV